MNAPLNAVVAEEHRGDLQRAAGCCTVMPELRRAATATARRGTRLRWSARRPVRPEPLACC